MTCYFMWRFTFVAVGNFREVRYEECWRNELELAVNNLTNKILARMFRPARDGNKAVENTIESSVTQGIIRLCSQWRK